MNEPSLIDIAGRLAILAANDGDENGDLNHVPKSIIIDAKAELDRLRAEVERLEERLAPCANWLRYAFKHVDSVTADHVKAWLAREPAG